MRAYFILCARMCLVALVFQLPLNAAESAVSPNPAAGGTETNKTVTPGKLDGRVAFWSAHLLQGYHYSQDRFDDSISGRFLDGYIDALDPQRLHFLRSDLDRFEQYRTRLDNLTLSRSGSADTGPAYEIFACYLERLSQRVEFADQLLKTEKFTFDSDERITLDRRKAPFPKDLDEARALWKQRLRFEYLQEKLGNRPTSARTSSPPGQNDPQKPLGDEEIVDKLSHRYHRNLKMFADWNNEDVMGVYLTALANVYDPHSDYFNRAELEGFKISMNLQLFGIGAELRSEDGYCRIERLLPGGPAIKSKKMNPGDHIVAVAQGEQAPVDVVDMHLTKIVQLIRGPKGTEVRLTVRPGGQKSSELAVVTLIRDEIPLEDQAARGSIIEWPNAQGSAPTRLGIIHLPSFYAPMDPGAPVAASGNADNAQAHYTSVDVAKLLAKFKEEKVRGVILDLRMNGGGVLEEAIRVAGLFIKQGPIVQVRDQEDRVKVDRDPEPSVAYDGPLLVLTSRFSASASEIVAGALQDYGRALIVGDASTHGKGTVQTVTSLRPVMRIPDDDPDEPGALKFTIRKFYRASGASTQAKGVLPDIVLPSRWNHSSEIGEAAMDNALPWDEIPPAAYEKLDLVQPHLSELLRRSGNRVATNQDFAYVFEDIEEFRKLQADKTVSLNEAQRMAEQAEVDARQKAREAELRARKASDRKVYEISLKQAELPGLPPPVQKTNEVASLSGDAAGATPVPAEEDTADTAGVAEEKAPAVDPHLDEAQRILMDYVELLSRKNDVVLSQSARSEGL